MFTLRNVTKRFGALAALDHCTLALERGKTTALIGPSGCGKSTLLRTLVGLCVPDTGTVEFEGRAVTEADWPTVRRRIGYVIQDGGLFPHLTAEENVTLAARDGRVEREQREERLRELAALVRLDHRFLTKYPGQLSGGQRQRVSLMRALFLDPDVLLLDEPMGALDPMVRGELQTDLRAIFAELAKTVVLVTHDLPEASLLGDSMVLLRDGRIVQQGLLSTFAEEPAVPFVASFLKAQRPVELLQ